MPDIPKYSGTTDPNKHITSYTCGIKGNDLEDDEIESVLLKKFRETLSKREMIWYHSLPPNSIDSFTMLDDSFVKVHAGAIKVATRKLNLFKVRQKDNEMALNERSSIASRQLKQNLIQYPAVTWADMLNRYQSKIRVKDDQLGALSGSIYPNRSEGRIQRDIDKEHRSNRDRYQPYRANQKNNGPGHNPIRNDRGRNSQGLMSKNGLDKHVVSKEAPRLSEYNFSIDASGIVSVIGRIKDTRWPRPMQINPAQRNPNQMCKYHGTHGHRTEDCRQLMKELACLFNEGHLREFLSDRAKNHFRDRDANRQK
uniref:Uncharacterized protein LOC104220739 n=1 Tax=Nicotiana sylvestris TaxID=4096 RepID=A0A1U7VPY8_NICSY|nr:PREDICTED: uncharacterized protein LOC104220739 [Nicotiana sylvestris]